MANLKVYGELHMGNQDVLYAYLGEECVYEFRHLSRPRTSFGGLHLAPGPMYLDTNTGVYSICSTWDQYNSYGQCDFSGGLPYNIADSNGMQTYFPYSTYTGFLGTPSGKSFGCLFDSTGDNFPSTKIGNGTGDKSIDNLGTLVSWDGDNDWRLPTVLEQETLVWGQTTALTGSTTKLREGSTVNGYTNVYSAAVRITVTKPYSLTDRSYIGGSWVTTQYVPGLLIFPDDKTITGQTVSGTWFRFDSSNPLVSYRISESPDNYQNYYGYWSFLTETQLNEYINQGCVFIPLAGRGYTDLSSGVWYTNSGTNGNYATEIWPSTHLNRYSNSDLITGSLNNWPYDVSCGSGIVLNGSAYGTSNMLGGFYMLYLVRDNN